MAQNISGGNPVNSSKSGFYCSDNTQKVDALPSSGSCDAVGIIKPKCLSDGCKCSDCFTLKPRKRKRLYSWQRRSKQKQLCFEDRSTELSKLNNSNQAAEVKNQRHSSQPTADNTSLGMDNDNNFPQTEEPGNVPVMSSKKSPSSVLDIVPSKGLSCGYNTPGDQSTRPQVGVSSYLQLYLDSLLISLCFFSTIFFCAYTLCCPSFWASSTVLIL
jgi:telomerase reverse transcriptase